MRYTGNKLGTQIIRFCFTFTAHSMTRPPTKIPYFSFGFGLPLAEIAPETSFLDHLLRCLELLTSKFGFIIQKYFRATPLTKFLIQKSVYRKISCLKSKKSVNKCSATPIIIFIKISWIIIPPISKGALRMFSRNLHLGQN